MESIYDRTRLVLGDELDKIQSKKILLLGVGGVGGYVLEMLVRIGVKEITIVDDDVFKESNLNRQVLSKLSNIGKSKVLVANDRVKDINPDVNIVPINIRLTNDNICEILSEKYDYVIDAIDDVPAKVALIRFCQANDIPLLSCMGTGNRYSIPEYVVTDISNTSYDKLAKKIRFELRKYNIYKGVDVCYTKSNIVKTQGLGSVIYHPLVCAGVMVSYVINKILKKI